jgi:hypothetical protein
MLSGRSQPRGNWPAVVRVAYITAYISIHSVQDCVWSYVWGIRVLITLHISPSFRLFSPDKNWWYTKQQRYETVTSWLFVTSYKFGQPRFESPLAVSFSQPVF